MPGRAALGHRLAVATRRAGHRRPLGGRAPAALPGRPGPRARPRMGAALPRRARRAASLGVPQVAGRHSRDLSPGRARLGEGPRQGGSVRSDACARDQSPGLGGPLRHTASLEPAGARLARLARRSSRPRPVRSTSGRARSTPRASSRGPRRRLGYLARVLLVPTLAERRLIRLPAALRALYYPLRPLRLGGRWGREVMRGIGRRFPRRLTSSRDRADHLGSRRRFVRRGGAPTRSKQESA